MCKLASGWGSASSWVGERWSELVRLLLLTMLKEQAMGVVTAKRFHLKPLTGEAQEIDCRLQPPRPAPGCRRRAEQGSPPGRQLGANHLIQN